MCHHVLPQSRSSGECLVTDQTGDFGRFGLWFCLCQITVIVVCACLAVLPYMVGQFIFGHEAFITRRAVVAELAVVRAHVLLVTGHCGQHLSAHRAGERLVIVLVHVRLEMAAI